MVEVRVQEVPQAVSTRLDTLLRESNDLIDFAVDLHFTHTGHRRVATVGLYSGGDDSTTMVHAFLPRLDYAAHCNTGIGIEATRQFVRDTCAAWSLPLLEVHPGAGNTYEELVMDQGFPGPAHHFKVYQRLKERGIRQVQRELVSNPRVERVLMLAGRRREESARRANVTALDREGSRVIVSPLIHWTKADLNLYRREHPDVPRNETAALLHMSGECLCGAFAHPGELEEIAYWYPEAAQHILDLETKVAATGKHPAWRCKWGWGAQKDTVAKLLRSGGSLSAEEIEALFDRSKVGVMCSSCEFRGAP